VHGEGQDSVQWYYKQPSKTHTRPSFNFWSLQIRLLPPAVGGFGRQHSLKTTSRKQWHFWAEAETATASTPKKAVCE